MYFSVQIPNLRQKFTCFISQKHQDGKAMYIKLQFKKKAAPKERWGCTSEALKSDNDKFAVTTLTPAP